MGLHVQPAPNFISQLRMAQVQSPQLTNNSRAISPLMPGLSADNPEQTSAWLAHNYTGMNGLPMHMPAYNGHGRTPAPMARPLPMPPLYSFNKLPRL